MTNGNAFLLAASALMLCSCGERLTKEQIIDYGEIGYSGIISYIVVGYQTNWDGMSLEEVSGGWDRSLMPISLERFTDLARPQQLCGGYTQQREPAEDEMEMFRSLTASSEVSYTPLSVSTQVVAGTNYRFYCRFEDTAEGTYGHCWITVFKPLPGQGEPSITSIEKEQ